MYFTQSSKKRKYIKLYKRKTSSVNCHNYCKIITIIIA